jgi:hypothetical protein
MSLKNPVTPPGIDPGTVQLVAQRSETSKTTKYSKTRHITNTIIHTINKHNAVHGHYQHHLKQKRPSVLVRNVALSAGVQNVRNAKYEVVT